MGKWTGVVTNAGDDLLNQWAGGEGLHIEGACAGEGTVEEAALMAQTGVTNAKPGASIVGHRKISKGIQIQMQITPPPDGYTLRQLGVTARVGDGPPALLAIFQNAEGIPIPGQADTQDFVYTFYGGIVMDNSGKFTVTVDASALVSIETLHNSIAEAFQGLYGAAQQTPGDGDSLLFVGRDGRPARYSWTLFSQAMDLSIKEAIDSLILSVMTNELTLPLAASGGEDLLTDEGTPILAVYHPNQCGGVMVALNALESELSGRIARTASDARTRADGAGREALAGARAYTDAKLAAHDASASAHPSHLAIVKNL